MQACKQQSDRFLTTILHDTEKSGGSKGGKKEQQKSKGSNSSSTDEREAKRPRASEEGDR